MVPKHKYHCYLYQVFFPIRPNNGIHEAALLIFSAFSFINKTVGMALNQEDISVGMTAGSDETFDGKAEVSVGRGQTKLKIIWQAKRKKLRLTQDAIKEKFGYSSQAAVSQALNGITPLTPETALLWAEILEVPVSDIWEGDLEAIAGLLDEKELLQRILKLDPKDRWNLYMQVGESFQFFDETQPHPENDTSVS